MTGQIIPLFPEAQQADASCFECVHGYMGRNGVLCELLNQIIFNPTDATNCEAYERDS